MDLLLLQFALPLLVVGLPIAIALVATRGSRTTTTSARPGRSEVVTWLVTLVASSAACGLALLLGMGLGLFGLGLAALIASLGLTAFATLVWKRGALPLTLVAASLAAGATLSSATPSQIDRSAGLLTVAPATAEDADGGKHVRGLGSVLVDLRETELPAGSTTRIAARSDAGRVVVALPNDRCVNLRVRATLKALDMSEAANLTVSVARRNGVLPEGESALGGLPSGAFDRSFPSISRLEHETPVMVAYGRTVFAGNTSPSARWTRTTREADAPTVVLDLAGSNITVRDYPRGTVALGRDRTAAERDPTPLPDGYPELRGIDWPAERWPAPSLIPPMPDEGPLMEGGTLTGEDWMRAAKRGAAEAARLAAGACATRNAVSSSWMRFNTPDGELGVNGFGQDISFGRPLPRSVAVEQ